MGDGWLNSCDDTGFDTNEEELQAVVGSDTGKEELELEVEILGFDSLNSGREVDTGVEAAALEARNSSRAFEGGLVVL